MKRRNFLTNMTAATGALLWQPAAQLFAQNLPNKPQNAPKAGAAPATQIARGVVLHDAAGNGARAANSKGVAGVAVSNGREVVVTDNAGRYELPVRIDDIIFVIKPAGWAPPLNAVNLPQFSHANKPQGSPDFKYKGFKPTGALPTSIDFALRPQTENEQFRMLLFGDPQPRNKELEKDVKVGAKSPHGRVLPETISSRHIWAAPMPANFKAGTHILQVRTKDMWNRTFTERRLLTVA